MTADLTALKAERAALAQALHQALRGEALSQVREGDRQLAYHAADPTRMRAQLDALDRRIARLTGGRPARRGVRIGF